MHIVYLVTSEKDQQCGVVDYTRQLAHAISDGKTKVTIEELPSWSLNALIRLRDKYKNGDSIVFHLQYPTLGMGKSFAPALLHFASKSNKIFITFHEFEQFSLIRKSYFIFSSLLNTSFIFTNEYEQEQFASFFPWAKKKSVIIPIGNNISAIPFQKKIDAPQHRLIYFGQIAPNKGIEEYLETVCCLRAAKNHLPCAIIGGLVTPSSELAQKVQTMAEKYNIECLFNLSSEDVSQELHKSSMAYLPFPSGVGDKRGSALACLKHDLGVITKHSEHTPQWWTESTHHGENAQHAAVIIQAISSGEINKVPVPSALKQAMDDREWCNIARVHTEVYTMVGNTCLLK